MKKEEWSVEKREGKEREKEQSDESSNTPGVKVTRRRLSSQRSLRSVKEPQ